MMPPMTIDERRARRRGWVKVGVMLGVLVFGGVPVMAAVNYLRPDQIDVAAVEDQIEAAALDDGVVLTADCPSKIDLEVGGDFRCVVEAEDGSRLLVVVNMENDEGEVTWQPEQ